MHLELSCAASLECYHAHDLHVMSNKEMNYWLARFGPEVWTQDGKPYSPSTMQQIVAAVADSEIEKGGVYKNNILTTTTSPAFVRIQSL